MVISEWWLVGETSLLSMCVPAVATGDHTSLTHARMHTHTHMHTLWPEGKLGWDHNWISHRTEKKIFERKGKKKTFEKTFDFLHCLISEINCRSESVCFSPNVCSQVAPSAAWSSFLFYHYHHYSATYTSPCPRVQWGTGVRRKYTMLSGECRERPVWCWLPCQQSGCWVYVATKRAKREKDRGSEERDGGGEERGC